MRPFILVSLAVALHTAFAEDLVRVTFLEPLAKIDTNTTEIAEKHPLFRKVADASHYNEWLHNEYAERAFRLYRAACDIVDPAGGVPDYFIALVPDGNHAAVGFRIQGKGGSEEHPRQPYILLDAQPERFQTTLLHETGHMAMAMVAGGRQLEGKKMASIPHSTAALSDRTTAFSEGYAIHLETLEAHVGSDPWVRQRFHRGMVQFGETPLWASEYFRSSADLMSYSQNVARYFEVRDNNYSFESAFQGPDYLRVQLEKTRDFSQLRGANQLLQSEGFYASFFFLFVMRGASTPAENVIEERERQILTSMRAMFAASKDDGSNPWLLNLVLSHMKQFPDQKATIIDAVNDLSHGVFVDATAGELWTKHYEAALGLDLNNLNLKGINEARKRWRDQVAENPQILFSRLGPEVHCSAPAVKVRLVAMHQEWPLEFDLNTVQPGILRLIPGISEAEIASWLRERTRRPFASSEDFRTRGILRPAIYTTLQQE